MDYTITYLGLIYEGALEGYPGKPMHRCRVTWPDGRVEVRHLNGNSVGLTEAECVAALAAMLRDEIEQAELDALVGQEV